MTFGRQKLTLYYGALGLAMGALLAAVGVAGYTLGKTNSNQQLPLPVLNAMGSTQGSMLSLATGPVDDVEGIFVLDHLTGELQCWVIGGRTGKFNSLFKYNVSADLGVEQGKKPDYTMVTGSANFRGGGASNNLASVICYVGDGNSGNVAAYAVPWNRALAAQSSPQSGSLIQLDIGKARLVDIRE